MTVPNRKTLILLRFAHPACELSRKIKKKRCGFLRTFSPIDDHRLRFLDQLPFSVENYDLAEIQFADGGFDLRKIADQNQ